MPSFTKKAIMESFLRLAGKKPLDKITVRDIVDDCGINRNTFYYYFQDIYAVLEEYCDLVLARLPQNTSIFNTVSALFQIAEDFTAQYPRAARMLALSLGFEGLERYFGARFEPFLAELIQKEYGVQASLIFLRFLRHGLVGLLLNVMCGEKLSENIAKELQHLLPAPPQNQTNSAN